MHTNFLIIFRDAKIRSVLAVTERSVYDFLKINRFYCGTQEKKDVVLITNISREKMRASLITDIQNSVAAGALFKNAT
jgi:hypothetical protein